MPRTVICGLDDVPRVLRDAHAIDPEDPRETGWSGASPGLRTAEPTDLAKLLYKHVGLYRVIVDKPAQDIWDQGWNLDLEPPDPRLEADVEDVDRRAGIKQALKRATIWARRDGKAYIILRLRDGTGDPSLQPRGVRGVVKAQPVPRHRVTDVRFAVEGDRAGEPEAYQVLRKNRGNGTDEPTWYHWQRVIQVIQHPDEDDDDEGISVLSWQLRDSQSFENVKWGAAESYYRYGAPLYAVHIDKEVSFDPDEDGKALETKLDALRNNHTQKAWFKGATIEAVTGSSRINEPGPYGALFMDALAGGAQIPKRELTGSEAGALASAGWDEKRYFNHILNDREDFGEPLIRSWYRRLDEWGLQTGLTARLRAITWPPHLELSEDELSQVMIRVGASLRSFAAVGLPAPLDVWDLLQWPDTVDQATREAPLQFIQPPAGIGGVGATRNEPRRRGDLLSIEFSEALVKIENRFQRDLLGVLRDWWSEAEDLLDTLGLDKKRRRRGDQPSAVMGLTFEDEELQRLTERVLRDSMSLGAAEMWNRLERKEEIFDVIDTQTWPTFSQFGRDWSQEKARSASIAVREKIATGIAEGQSLGQLRRGLRDQFGVLENETVIARTEALRGYNGGAMEAMHHAGVLQWEWVAFQGACPICLDLEGRRFPVGDVDILPPDGSHPACRCQVVPVVD